MNNILQIKNLSKTYYTLDKETIALDNLSFDIKENEFISIVGPSGCGKSTILNILAELDKDYKGHIIKKNNLLISYMTQEDALFPWLTVLDNALLGLKVQKKLTKENIKYVNDLLDKYGLKNFKDSKINNLSGGMRQRVALIRTIAIKPDLIFLDEPYSALDYVTRLKVSDDIYKIIKNENITALMVTHDIGEAVSISDRVVVLTKRPATIKNIYNINLKKKSTPINNRNDEYFTKYYEILWKDIDNNE